jgi:hypothetical protein
LRLGLRGAEYGTNGAGACKREQCASNHKIPPSNNEHRVCLVECIGSRFDRY